MSRYLLAVDPGIRGCGVALFKDGVLERATYVRSAARAGNGAEECAIMADCVVHWVGHCVSEIAVEWPRIYATRIRQGKTKTDPNDLLALCGVDAAIVSETRAPATSYAPSDWKGQLKDEACRPRVKSRLTPAEMAIALAGEVAAKSLAHNMWDAIGIGLHHLGRFDKKRVIPT